MNLADVDRRKLTAAGGAAVLVLVAGMALAYRVLSDDDDPDAAVDPGNPVTQPETTAGESTASTGATTTESPAVPLDQIALTAVEIGQYDAPISIVPRTGDDALYVAERGGIVRRVTVSGEGADRTYQTDSQPVIDISDQVTVEGERGLLDIAFSPDGNRLYLSYSQAPEGTSKVASYDFDGTTADPGSRREIIAIEDFRPNHNGGDIQFGPDGYLWFAMGDGGGSGDPQQTAQNTEQLLGKIMRIDPEGATGGEAYAIPADNPFADGSGGRPEIWIYGVRNPWRFSFDRANGDLWIGDVGQNAWEEIDYFPAANGPPGRGANLGWSEMEASHSFDGGENPEGAVLPIFEYPNGDGGCAITGGPVYRGADNPGLQGAYLFGDFCRSRLRGLRLTDGAVTESHTFETTVPGLVSFGEDNDGEVYAVSLDGSIFRLDT